MKSSFILGCIAVGGLGWFAQSNGETAFKSHVDMLQSAPSMTVNLTVAKLPGSPIAASLTFSKKGMFRIDTADKLFISNGTIMWVLDKKANTYQKTLPSNYPLQTKEAFLWMAFFYPDAMKSVTNVTPGGKRQIKGVNVQEWNVVLSGKEKATFFVDTKTSMIRGATFQTEAGELLVMATEINIGKAVLPENTFDFQPPAGAKPVEEVSAESVTYAQVEPIFRRNCLACHSNESRKGGFSLATYESLMAGTRNGKVVVPGEPDNSPLLGMVKGTRRPMMPRNADPLSKEQIAIIEAWIKGGCKQ